MSSPIPTASPVAPASFDFSQIMNLPGVKPGYEFLSKQFAENPYAVSALGALALGALVVPASAALDKRATKKVFDQVLVQEWFLPSKATLLYNATIAKLTSAFGLSGPDMIEPVFNDATTQEISTVRQMIIRSLENGNKSPPPNLIFHGKAGVGKTMLAEYLARTSGMGFIRIPSGAMENHLKMGTHIVAFHKILQEAQKCARPVCIIMDDGEELVCQRSPSVAKAVETNTTKAAWLVEEQSLSEIITQRRVALVNAILEESGKDNRKVSFCITTNRPEIIDKAFGTRARTIVIDVPGFEERKGIVIVHLPRIFNNDGQMLNFFGRGRLEDMAKKTEAFTGRNIVKMLENVHACVQLDNGDIRQDTIDASIAAIRKSINPAPVAQMAQRHFEQAPQPIQYAPQPQPQYVYAPQPQYVPQPQQAPVMAPVAPKQFEYTAPVEQYAGQYVAPQYVAAPTA